MSMGSNEDGELAVRDSVKSEARRRNKAVCVRAERGTLRWRDVDATKVVSQDEETGRDLSRNWAEICWWMLVVMGSFNE